MKNGWSNLSQQTCKGTLQSLHECSLQSEGCDAGMLKTGFTGPYWLFPYNDLNVRKDRVEGVGPADELQDRCECSVDHDTCNKHIFHGVVVLRCGETMESTDCFQDLTLPIIKVLSNPVLMKGQVSPAQHQAVMFYWLVCLGFLAVTLVAVHFSWAWACVHTTSSHPQAPNISSVLIVPWRECLRVMAGL